jgi:signal transduction histidine kinase
MSSLMDPDRMQRLLHAGRVLLAELDERTVLDRMLETARDITGARYAALGILNERRDELDQFLTRGIDEQTHRSIGDLPRGRGVLGTLISDPRPLRLANVGQHPQSYGFPTGHPVMRSFLGVPIVVRGEAWGNLYLTEKDEGEFTDADEEAALILGEWAAVAIENARLYHVSEQRNRELEKALRGLRATSDVVQAIGGETELDRILELIVKRGRALVDARSLVIMLREGPDLAVAASAGDVEDVRGVRLPIAGSTSGEVLLGLKPERIANVAARLRISPSSFGIPDAHAALLVPLVYRGSALGVLAAFDRGEEAVAFSEDDEQLLRTFAASAATAVAMAQTVQSDRLRSSLAAADAERQRWARELHDETLQGLGGLRLLLSAALRRGDDAKTTEAVAEAIDHIEHEIANLRAIITDLRPAALDELGLGPAIEALIDRHRERDDFEIVSELAIIGSEIAGHAMTPELETAVYRIVQESLTNVAKHARAQQARVAIAWSDQAVTIEVQDDGAGFRGPAQTSGFGLAGMRERVSLAGGVLTVDSDKHGTLVRARLPMSGGVANLAAKPEARQAAS